MLKSIQLRKKLATLSAAIFCLAILEGANNSTKAQLSTYEGFNYPAGSVLSNNVSSGTGWGLNWSIDGSGAANGIIGSSSLSSSSNPSLTTSGQSLSVGSGTIYTRQLASTLGTSGSTTTVWAGLLFLGGAAATPNESRIGFYSGMGEGTVVDGNTASASAGTTQVVDLGKAATGSDMISLYNGATINSSGVATPRGSDAALLLLRFDLNGSVTADTLSLWVNPNLSLGVGGLGTAQSSWTTADLDLINGFRLQAGSAGGFSLDEIRIGSTFLSVTAVPEPTTITLLTCGGLAFLLTRMKRRA